jgi:hypothetical protein
MSNQAVVWETWIDGRKQKCAVKKPEGRPATLSDKQIPYQSSCSSRTLPVDARRIIPAVRKIRMADAFFRLIRIILKESNASRFEQSARG